MMKKILGYILILIVMLILLPILVIGLPFIIFNSIVFNWHVYRFYKENNGRMIFWYSSKKKFLELNESIILPIINYDSIIIYNNQSVIESSLNRNVLNHIRTKFTDNKLPLVIKINDKKMNSESLYSIFMDYKMRKNDLTETKEKIEELINSLNSV